MPDRKLDRPGRSKPAWMERASKAIGADVSPTTQPSARSGATIAMALDGTGSMEQLIGMARRSMGEIIARVGREGGAPHFRLYVYRDYDVVEAARPELLLETGELSCDPERLRCWLDEKRVAGGGGNDGEAVEVALEDVLKRGEARVVMIAGDEPANDRNHIDGFGFRQRQTAVEIARLLGQRRIPVHTFTVGSRASAKRSFREIAEASGGQAGQLDGGADMIDMAVIAILKALRGDAAVKRYVSRESITTNAAAFATALLSPPKKD